MSLFKEWQIAVNRAYEKRLATFRHQLTRHPVLAPLFMPFVMFLMIGIAVLSVAYVAHRDPSVGELTLYLAAVALVGGALIAGYAALLRK